MAKKAHFFQYLLRTLLIIVLLSPVCIVLLGLQTSAKIEAVSPLGNQALNRVQNLILDRAPANPSLSSQQQVQLNNEELNLLLRYGMELLATSEPIGIELSVQEQLLESNISLKLSDKILPLYLNLTARFESTQHLPVLNSLRIGNLEIPQRLLLAVTEFLKKHYLSDSVYYQDVQALLENIEYIDFSSNQMEVLLHWDPNLISRISNNAQQMFISDADRQRIVRHYRVLTEVAASFPESKRAAALKDFLAPMFLAAITNSQGDPIAENRTLFQTLAIYVNNENIEQLLGTSLAQSLPQAKYIEVRVQRRQDLAKHIISIAAITASAGVDVAELLSTTKEAYDARYRMGFSFSDLTANIAGVSLARLATQDENSARIMQQRLSQLSDDSDYLPLMSNQADGLSEADFNTLYQDQSSPSYLAKVAEIRKLVSASVIFEGLQ
ncbi:MAG: hypothetical protein COC19_05770 [SAR86 cluster bacterium]|uniref:Uncharacterized protein n=1 Tax=SAR86 cluster bacterium TaxID=2030880 RepID=A0A2A4ML21_9GAMM|nr:MAG: hypothetical protein COC19_05770 [SAR86 cluster bacterium]